MVLAAYCLLKKNPDPREDEIIEAIDGNLCRCTGYVKIIEAVKIAAKRMRENG
jgi:carbon-monoxide dehydrogenase small subunit